MGITQIIKRNGTIIPLNTKEPFCVLKEATLNSSLMGDDTVTLKIVSSVWLSFEKGDKITLDGYDYSIRTTTTREIQAEDYYIYEPVFYGPMYDLMKTIYRNTDRYGKSDKSTFDLTYTLKEFVQVIIYNLNRDYPGLWAFDEENCPETEPLTIQFSGVNCLQVLQSLCSENNFNYEFLITQENGLRTIHIGKFGQRVNPPAGTDYFEVGKGSGLYHLKEQKIDDKAIITRLWVEGGTNNIRTDYRDYSERLQLPYPRRLNKYEHTLFDGKVIAPNTENIGISDDSKRYFEDAALKEKLGSEEDTKTYDNIYPTRTGKVTAIVDDDINSFIDDTMDFDLNAKNDSGTIYLVDGVSAKITFVSGKLAGQQFELEAKGGYDNAKKKFKLIPFTDKRGLTVPTTESEAYRIQVGDTYKITDIFLPESYEQKAEEDLWYAGYNDFVPATQPKAQYVLTLDRLYFLNAVEQNTEICFFKVGDYVPVKDERFGIEKQIRIQKLTRNLLVEQDYQLTLSDITAISIANQTILDVIEHDKIIENNRLRDLNAARRGWRTTEDLRNMVYDTDGYFDVDNIRPNSIDTNMLTVGSKSQQFVLTGVILQANYQGNPNSFVAGAGILSHLTIDENKIRSWQLNGATFTLNNANGFYVFARCSRDGETGTWVVSQTQYKVDSDPNFYYFQVGIISKLYPDDNFRDFVTTYGFTRINGNTITTGRIVTSDGECYLDLDGNKFRIGDATSSIDWNVTRKNTISLKNVVLVSESGESSPIGVFRGVWDASYTYYYGDEVSYTENGSTCTYRYINPNPTKGNKPTDTVYWMVVAQGLRGDFKSTVFKRSAVKPIKPSGGTYDNPVPSGWSDGVPDGAAILWASSCTFYGAGGSSGWSDPAQETDTATLDIEFSPNATQPAEPAGTSPLIDNTIAREKQGWYDPSSENFAGKKMIWRAERKIRNGVYDGAWVITRIYGEKGDDGNDGINGDYTEYRYAVNGSRTDPPTLNATQRNPSGWSTAMPSVGVLQYLWLTKAIINGETGGLRQNWSTPVRTTPYDGTDGKDGANGQSSFTSYVFRRAASAPATPSGGSFSSPYPTTTGWSDGVPAESNGYPVWMSSRVFTSDGQAPQQSGWSAPKKLIDTADIDFEFSAVATNPGNPTSNPSNWHNTATANDIWMAVRKQSNGSWGSWEVSKIKGEKGEDGASPYYLDLSNEMAGIACNANGTVTGSYPTSQATVYCGAREDTGWSFNVSCTDCNATVNAKGLVTVSAISADTASIIVTATKANCPTLSTTMSLYKVKPGSDGTNGTSPTIYSIETSVSSVSKDANGNLNPTSVTCYKYSQTGNGTRGVTGANRLVGTAYNKSGGVVRTGVSADGSGSSLTIAVSSTVAYIEFILYSGSSSTIILDRETVPVVSDGANGKDGEDGKDGKNGPGIVYRGTYNSSMVYYGTDLRVDVVKYAGQYYVARIDAGAFSNVLPTNTSKWNSFGANFESVATQLLLAEFAYIENLGVRDLLTNQSGKRVHISQDENAMTVYDSDDAASIVIAGETLSDSNLFGGASQNVSPTNLNRSMNSGNELHSNSAYETTVNLGTFTFNNNGVFSGKVVINPSFNYSKGTTSSGGNGLQDFQRIASVSISIFIDNTYLGSCTVAEGTIDGTQSNSQTTNFNAAISPGTHTIKAKINVSCPTIGTGGYFNAYAVATFSNCVATAEIKMSRYFANGNAVGCSSNQYSETIMENNKLLHKVEAGNVGIHLNNGVMKLKIGGTWYTVSRDSSGTLKLT